MSVSGYRVWCLTWEDTEESGKSYPDKPTVKGGYLEQILANDRWALDAKDAAEIYADWCHRQRDGWESSWPLTFRVRSPDGNLSDFEVERETVPEFHAFEIKKPSSAEVVP